MLLLVGDGLLLIKTSSDNRSHPSVATMGLGAWCVDLRRRVPRENGELIIRICPFRRGGLGRELRTQSRAEAASAYAFASSVGRRGLFHAESLNVLGNRS